MRHWDAATVAAAGLAARQGAWPGQPARVQRAAGGGHRQAARSRRLRGASDGALPELTGGRHSSCRKGGTPSTSVKPTRRHMRKDGSLPASTLHVRAAAQRRTAPAPRAGSRSPGRRHGGPPAGRNRRCSRFRRPGRPPAGRSPRRRVRRCRSGRAGTGRGSSRSAMRTASAPAPPSLRRPPTGAPIRRALFAAAPRMGYERSAVQSHCARSARRAVAGGVSDWPVPSSRMRSCSDGDEVSTRLCCSQPRYLHPCLEPAPGDPHAMHDHRELARYSHSGALGTTSAGYGHTPSAELRRLTTTRHQRRGCLIK